MLHIGILQFTLEIPYAETLKDKRGPLKALKRSEERRVGKEC